MIPNIVRGSDPAGLVRYLFGKGRRNEHTDQHLVCASGDMFPSFDMDGKPAASYAEIGRRFDRRYRVRERKDDPFPPDMRGKNNPEREHGRKRVWHCSLAIKAGQGILTDQEWEAVIRDYLTRMNIIDGDDDQGVTWLAVRHGLSANGNDHVHIMVQLAADDGWINPYHDRINAQRSCRRMEKSRPELVGLARSDTGTRVSWQYGQWRQWAEWKARNGYGDDEYRAAMREGLHTFDMLRELRAYAGRPVDNGHGHERKPYTSARRKNLTAASNPYLRRMSVQTQKECPPESTHPLSFIEVSRVTSFHCKCHGMVTDFGGR